MYFREHIEEIMAKALLPEDDKDILVETLTSYVLSYKALSALDDNRIVSILKKIEDAGLLGELQDLLEKKSKFVDNTPIENIGDGLSMIH